MSKNTLMFEIYEMSLSGKSQRSNEYPEMCLPLVCTDDRPGLHGSLFQRPACDSKWQQSQLWACQGDSVTPKKRKGNGRRQRKCYSQWSAPKLNNVELQQWSHDTDTCMLYAWRNKSMPGIWMFSPRTDLSFRSRVLLFYVQCSFQQLWAIVIKTALT